jgi:hypothetical protein
MVWLLRRTNKSSVERRSFPWRWHADKLYAKMDSFSCRQCTLIRKLRPPRKSFPPLTTQARNPPRWINPARTVSLSDLPGKRRSSRESRLTRTTSRRPACTDASRKSQCSWGWRSLFAEGDRSIECLQQNNGSADGDSDTEKCPNQKIFREADRLEFRIARNRFRSKNEADGRGRL